LLKSIIESRNISENSLKSVHKKPTYDDWGGAWPRGPLPLDPHGAHVYCIQEAQLPQSAEISRDADDVALPNRRHWRTVKRPFKVTRCCANLTRH